MTKVLKLTKLVCENQQEMGHDEIKLKVTVFNHVGSKDVEDCIFTKRKDMNRYDDKKWDLTKTSLKDGIQLVDKVEVKVTEVDPINDDIIGTVTITRTNFKRASIGDKVSTPIKGARARYRLYWEYATTDELEPTP